jgi:hypothetical protein
LREQKFRHQEKHRLQLDRRRRPNMTMLPPRIAAALPSEPGFISGTLPGGKLLGGLFPKA